MKGGLYAERPFMPSQWLSDGARPFCRGEPKLTLKRLINLLGVETHDDRTTNETWRCDADRYVDLAP
jgi:hypothetical protein